MDGRLKTARIIEFPTATSISHESFDQRLGLGHKNVFNQRFDPLVLAKLAAAIVTFCGRGKDLYDYLRVNKCVGELIVEHGRTANDRRIWVAVEPRIVRLHTLVAGLNAT